MGEIDPAGATTKSWFCRHGHLGKLWNYCRSEWLLAIASLGWEE